jgi:hypothetical protein
MTLLLCSSYLATEYCVIDHQHDNRSDDRDDHAVEVEAGNPAGAEGAEDKASDDRPDNSEIISRKTPSPDLGTILLAMKPAMRPSKIHPMIDITETPFVWKPCPG